MKAGVLTCKRPPRTDVLGPGICFCCGVGVWEAAQGSQIDSDATPVVGVVHLGNLLLGIDIDTNVIGACGPASGVLWEIGDVDPLATEVAHVDIGAASSQTLLAAGVAGS